jgi:protease I
VKIALPLPATDFDPSEAAIPWRILRAAGHVVVFATPDGAPATADRRMLDGGGLGPWKALLAARADAVAAYGEMANDDAFRRPTTWDRLSAVDVDAALLPGGHAQGMRPYLESTTLQRFAGSIVAADKPLASICHGVLLAARATDPRTGRSLVADRRVTALTKPMELSAWTLTRAWLGDYYRTYPETVEDEIKGAVPAAFLRGPFAIARDAPDRLDRGFVVEDGPLITARWPGDAHAFAAALLARLPAR